MGKVAAALAAVALAALCGAAFAGGANGVKAKEKTVEELIRDLGSEDFQTREEATAELGERGEAAIRALEEATKDPDPEVRWRAEKALRAARAKAGERPAPPAPREGERAPERTTPDARDPLERLREAEERLRRLHPEIEDLLDSLRLEGRLPRELGRILEDMERRLRDLDRPLREPPAIREFWQFRFKDGRWEVVRGPDPLAERVGLRAQPVPPVARAQLGIDGEDGLAIEEVRPGTIADRAGIRRWDIVLEVDGAPVRGDADLEALARPGEHAIAILRRGERKTLTVRVEPEEAAPPPDGGPAAPPAPPPPERGPAGPTRKY